MMNIIKITKLKEGMSFSEPLFYKDSTYSFYLPKGNCINRGHKYHLLFQGVYQLYTKGIILNQGKKSIFEIENEINKLLEDLEKKKSQTIIPKEIDFHYYKPKIDVLSQYRNLFKKFTEIAFSNFNAKSTSDTVKKNLDDLIKEMIELFRNNKKIIFKIINYYDLLIDFKNVKKLEQSFVSSFISLVISDKLKLSYQYTIYLIRALLIYRWGNLPFQSSLNKNEKLKHINSNINTYHKKDRLILLNKEYFHFNNTIIEIIENCNKGIENKRADKQRLLINLANFSEKLSSLLKKKNYNGFIEILPLLTVKNKYNDDFKFLLIHLFEQIKNYVK